MAALGPHGGEKRFHQEPSDTKTMIVKWPWAEAARAPCFQSLQRFFPHRDALSLPAWPTSQLPGSGRSPACTPKVMDFTQGGRQVRSPPPITLGGRDPDMFAIMTPDPTAHPAQEKVLNINLSSQQTYSALKNSTPAPGMQRKST